MTFTNTTTELSLLPLCYTKVTHISCVRRHDTNKKQEALLEIVKDNKIMLRHLSQCTPYYSVQVWNEQWMKTLDLMKSIGRFPPLSHAQVRYKIPLHFFFFFCRSYSNCFLLFPADCKCFTAEHHDVI